MKHGKKPTRQQRELMSEYRLNTENWLVVKDTPDEMVIVHRHSDQQRTIRKERYDDD